MQTQLMRRLSLTERSVALNLKVNETVKPNSVLTVYTTGKMKLKINMKIENIYVDDGGYLGC